MVELLLIPAVPVVGESLAYLVHILLHSEKIPLMSRAHMAHHLKHYSPKVGLRTGDYVRPETYRVAALARFGFGGVEILIPGMILNGLILGGFYWLGVHVALIAAFAVASNGWVWFSFNYMHNGIHVRDFWMLRFPLLRRWFRYIRRQHDIHHCHFTDDGRLTKNFGMTTFVMDRVFGTYTTKGAPFNEQGYAAAIERYKSLLD